MNTGSRRAAAVIRGLAALLMLLVLLVGLPVALLKYGGSVIPDHWSFSPSGIANALGSPDSGRLFMQALVLIGAIGWLCFVMSVLVELSAQVSRRPTVRIPGLSWSQQAAATLVTSIVVMFAAPLAAAAPAPAHLPSPAVTITAQQAPVTLATTSTSHHAESGHSGTHVTSYTVQPGDSLWKIAQEQLGNGSDYPAIVALNSGRVMPDGTSFHTEGFLKPGWTLLLPSDRVQIASGPHDTPEDRHVVTPGESLWEIAGHDYGDSTQWPRIFAANEGAEQNGGHFTNPNLIFPGEQLKIPHLPAPPPPVAEAPTIATPQTTVPAHSGTDAPAGSAEARQAANAAVASVADAMHDPERSGTSMTPAQIPAASAPAATATDHQEASLLVAFGISAMSAATLLALLAYRRKNQQNQRLVGQRIAMPDLQAASLERQLRTGADPASRDFLDRVLRTLAKHSADTGRLIPEIAAAVLRKDGVELRLSHPCPPITPFTALDDAVWWCAKDQTKLLPRKAAGEQPVPYPALVIMGETDGGDAVLLDLEHYGVVEIGGDQRQAAGVVQSLGVELPWLDYVSVAPAGMTLSPDLARNPVRHDAPEQILPGFEQWAQAVSEALPDDAGTGTEPLRAARIGQTSPGVTEPRVLLGASGWATSQAAERLNAVAARQPRAGAAAVIAVDDNVAPAGHRITVDAAGNALLHDLNLTVTMQRVDDQQYDRLLAVMTPTLLPAVTEPEWPLSVDEFNRTATEQPGLNELIAREVKFESVCVRVLGTIEVAGPVPVTDPKLLEAAAYVALHPGSSITSLGTDLGLSVQAAGTRLGQLRDTIGLDGQGRELLPITSDGRIAFSGLVGCDWFGFEEHRRSGRFAEALALVRGEPFADARPGRYGWIEPYRQSMISTVIDVAHTLAQTYRENHDFGSARLAIGRGLLAAPFAELLHRDLMLVVASEARPDRDEELASLFATFNEVCDEHGIEPMPDTVKVMQQLNGLVRKPAPGLRSVS